MSIAAIASSVSYDGNDVADEFPVPFRFLEDNDLLVRTTDDDGDTYTTLVLDDDYTLDGAGPDDGTGTAEGGTLELTGGPLASGTTLVIERTTDQTQANTFTPQGEFSPIQYSRMVDKLTLIVQELTRRIAVLEALGGQVTQTDLGDGATASGTLAVGNNTEDAFPFNVAVTNAAQVGWVVMQIQKHGGSETFDEPPVLEWAAGDATHISVKRISGLSPNTSYDYSLLCIYTP